MSSQHNGLVSRLLSLLSFKKKSLGGGAQQRGTASQAKYPAKTGSHPLSESDALRRRQILVVVGIGLIVVVGIVVVQLGFQKANAPKPLPEKPRKAVIGDFVDDRDVWASRLEAQMEKMTALSQGFKAQNELQEKRLSVLETALLSKAQGSKPQSKDRSHESSQTITGESSEFAPKPDVLFQDKSSPQGSLSGNTVTGPTLQNQPFSANAKPFSGSGVKSSHASEPITKILHYSISSPHRFHSAKDYVVSGSYARAVLTAGVVVSTAVETQGQPQPIVMRLGDHGNLPRGWKSRLKDAVLIGSCYGDLSSERAMCRIHSLSYVEPNGHAIEKKVEGWIIGEDGAPGLRGRVVDRAGSVAREAMVAGVLSGMSNFFKNEANSSVYPKTPFGQTNALNGTDAVKTGIGSGASNALEKLADFSIKRAEAMSPVLVVNPGRVVDVVFKTGFDLRPVDRKYTSHSYQRLSGHTDKSTHHKGGTL